MTAAAGAATGTAAAAMRAAAGRDSQSNGSLMRVSPIGVRALDPDTAAQAARQDSELSHPHPVCAAAHAAFADAIAAGILGADNPGMLEAAARAVEDDRSTAPAIAAALEAARDGRRPATSTRNMGWVVITSHGAFYHLSQAPSLEAALVDTIAQGGDTDTNSAFVGAPLGAADGRSVISPRWTSTVLGCRPIRELGARKPRPPEYWPDDIVALAEALVSARHDTSA